RLKDRDHDTKFFDAANKGAAHNGATPMRSVVAAFTLLRQVQGDRGEWQHLLDSAESVLRSGNNTAVGNEDKLYIAIQAGQIAFDKANDIERARKFFAIAARIEPKNPSVQDFVQAVGLELEIEEPPAPSGSMPIKAQAV